jgi:hypothetical protein
MKTIYQSEFDEWSPKGMKTMVCKSEEVTTAKDKKNSGWFPNHTENDSHCMT